jgi:predicted transglutaminase-like cysteine proteinase
MLDEFSPASMPSGLVSLCARQPEVCSLITAAAQPLALSPALWKMLVSVNVTVNHSIASVPDETLYGQMEYWTYPQQAGDCEDFVLLKRRMLAGLGIPLGSLLITVVHDENGEGHAVLSVPTSGGDVVLDNRRDEVLHWLATGYKFVKRQSAANPNQWVALDREKLQATNIASGPEASPHN